MIKNILVQIGHEPPREPGFEGGTGAAGELEANRQIAAALREQFKGDGRFALRVIPGAIPSDVRSGAWRVDAFVSLHCDGSGDPTVRGPAFGWPRGFDAENRPLANLIHEEFGKIPHPSAGRARWNYTRNMSGYYAWSRVPTPGPEVLVEHGFVSNPEERAWINAHAGELARAEYVAVCRWAGVTPQGEAPIPTPAPPPVRRRAVFRLVGPGGNVLASSVYVDAGTGAEALRLLIFLARNGAQIIRRLRLSGSVTIVREVREVAT